MHKPKFIKTYVVINIVLCGVLGIILFAGIMPDNPLDISKDFKKGVTIFMCERWCFFTKNPKEERVYIFSKVKDSYIQNEFLPNSSSKNGYGLISNQKAIGLEYGILVNKIDSDLWIRNPLNSDLFKTIDSTSTVLMVKKNKRITYLKGEFIFVQVEPVPYLWRNKVGEFEMPSKFVKIKIIE